jgi:putative endonuclease
MNLKQQIGEDGEQIAVEYLLSQGYKIIERNFHSRKGEIDIIAEDGEILCFIEVKYYRQGSLRDLHLAVDRTKQQKIVMTAQKYLFMKKIEDRYTRFDVVLISCTPDNKVNSLELYKDAFRPE